MLPRPVRSRTSAISSRFSEAWLCTSSACCCDRWATASSRSREQDTANRGAKAARSRPLARPCQRDASARLSSTDACVRSSSRAGTASVGVHHALADHGAQAGGLHRLEHRVGIVHRLHGQHGGGAAQQQLGGGERRGGRQRLRGMRGLHGPDARAQPVEQREIVGKAAEQRLTQMDVGLHESGKQVVASGVNRRRERGASTRADRDNAAGLDRARRLRSRRRRRSS